jgi:hypothetical protein
VAAKKHQLKAVAKTKEETSSKKTCSKKEIKWSLILEPINTETLELIHGLTSQQLGESCFSYERAIPDLDKINIAVIEF